MEKRHIPWQCRKLYQIEIQSNYSNPYTVTPRNAIIGQQSLEEGICRGEKVTVKVVDICSVVETQKHKYNFTTTF